MNREEIIRRVRSAPQGRRRSAPGGGSGSAAPPLRGDHELNPDLYPPERELKAAGVLVPLIERRGELTVLLTRRTEHLYDHAGQISFPGGRVDPGDEGPVAAALREAAEEVGLPPGQVELAGELVEASLQAAERPRAHGLRALLAVLLVRGAVGGRRRAHGGAAGAPAQRVRVDHPVGVLDHVRLERGGDRGVRRVRVAHPQGGVQGRAAGGRPGLG